MSGLEQSFKEKGGRTGVMLKDDLLGHFDGGNLLSFSDLLTLTHLPVSIP